MRYLLTLLFSLVTYLSFGQSLEDGLEKLNLREYDQAIAIFDKLLTNKPNETALLYNRSRATFLRFQAEKRQEEKTEDLRFKNFQSQHDTLKHIFSLTEKALESYRNLSEDEKNKLIAKGITNFKDVFNLKEGIAKEASDLITKAFYYFPYQQLPAKPPYNRPEHADTTQALRHQLIVQSTDFLKNFPKTRAYDGIKAARKMLLSEYITIPSLRARGTGNGYLYEKYCDCILEDYTEDELRNIIPEFYGANWDLPMFGYKSNAVYQKLESLAKSQNLSVLELFCKLNLHYQGISHINGTCQNCDIYDKFIQTIAPHQLAFVAVQKRAAYFVSQKKWNEAIAIYQQFKPLFPTQSNEFDKIIALLNAPEDNLNLQNLGATINTEKVETAPVPFLDSYGNEGLYFCRMNLGTGQDVYFSSLQDGKYTPAIRLNDNVNTNTHEVPQSVSFDGSTLVLFGNYGFLDNYKLEMRQQNNQLGNGDLFFAERNTDKSNSQTPAQTWGRIKAFPVPINTPSYEAGLSFSADGNAVFFASDREGVVGQHLPKAPKDRLYFHGREEFNIDLWVSERTAEGWTEPVNLGETINTPFAETQPFLHPDMKTLYFVSDGHYGLGSGDIFMSKRLSDTSWTSWSEPVNLGKSINTPFLDGFYMGISGQFAFIVMKDGKDSKGTYDIYRFDVPERFRPEPVKPIIGKVTDKNGKPIQTRIIVENLRTGQQIASTTSSNKDGSFQISVPPSSFLGFYAEEDGYFSTSSNQVQISTTSTAQSNSKVNSSNTIQVHQITELITEKRNITLNNIFFDFDSYALQAISYPELKRLAKVLQKNSTLKIVIEGYTDNTGKAEYNLQLSENRAKAVADYLISLGIAQGRVRYKGFGAEKPIADNFNEEGRSRNRRVEFRLEK